MVNGFYIPKYIFIKFHSVFPSKLATTQPRKRKGPKAIVPPFSFFLPAIMSMIAVIPPVKKAM